MEYISCAEAAAKWDISERRVQNPCGGERIPGAGKFTRVLVCHQDAEQANDGGSKSGMGLDKDLYNSF